MGFLVPLDDPYDRAAQDAFNRQRLGSLPQVQNLSIQSIYSPTQATDQKTIYNPMSTSHNYLQRFGLAKHF